MSDLRIAFFGLGNMGSGMVRRLLDAKFPVTLFTRDAGKAASFQSQGARIAPSPRAAAEGASLVISIVADDAASRATWQGNDGALAGAAAGAVLIECSTLSVGWVRELAGLAEKRGCELLDAPVTGSKSHAAAGELNFLVGGSAGALEKANPAFKAMGKSVTHIGPSGTGALLKLINNFLCGVQAASMAEAIALIEKSGLDRAKSLEVLLNGAPGSGVLKTVVGRAQAGDFTPNFRLRLMAKDLMYAIQEGKQHGILLTSAAAAAVQFERAVASGDGEKDFSAILEQSRKT